MPSLARFPSAPLALLVFGVVVSGSSSHLRRREFPVAIANDNRLPAGTLHGNVLTVRLVVQTARWFPEADNGPSLDVQALAEEGKAPSIPGPLIRVPAGTTIEATIRNALTDSAVTLFGLATRPNSFRDSVRVAPGETRVLRFVAGAPGTYAYGATAGRFNPDSAEREQLAGAFIVDSAGASAADRVFVINIWGQVQDSVTYRNALTINGKSWPFTERIGAAVGDTLRWRIVNASHRAHPMHLHGFYFRVDAHGDGAGDTIYSPRQRRLAVTEQMEPSHTIALTWSPTRPGNWLFHCHLGFHVVPESRLEPPPPHNGDMLAHDPARHMAGLVVGIVVEPKRGWRPPPRPASRRVHLFVQEGRKRGRAPRSMSFVLQRGNAAPAPDSVEAPGSTLVLTRGQPTDITVVNRLNEATGVHWHGIELESYSDGVVGWSGAGSRVAPLIAPRDSFTAHLTLPRAGTFIYHTHLNDLEQLTSGLYGALVVLEPGEHFDPGTDHVFVVGWDGPDDPPHLWVNGDSLPTAALAMAFGRKHRLRFISIGVAVGVRFVLRRDNTLMTWRAVAKDGADLPPAQATMRPAMQLLSVGETYDFEFNPQARGNYVVAIENLDRTRQWQQRIEVR